MYADPYKKYGGLNLHLLNTKQMTFDFFITHKAIVARFILIK
jgi:hypothetical protein